jgi:hypothetical protein
VPRAAPTGLPLLIASLALLIAPGCGGASYAYGAPQAAAPGGYDEVATAGGLYESDDSGGSEGGDGGGAYREQGNALYAQAETGASTPPADGEASPTGGQPQQPQQTPEATDAPEQSGPLLIYNATMHLSVFEVEQNLRAVGQAAEELHGFLVSQNDRSITIRVPAAQFRDALARIEQLGDVIHRNVEAQDVSEEFRDLHIRLRNAEATMRRLHALLERAERVEDALHVQRELARVTEEVERMRGRLRFLQHRLAFSTITVHFQPRPQETVSPDIFRLPFPWLDELGLRTLLNLRR